MRNATRFIAAVALAATFGLTMLAPATADAEPACYSRPYRVAPEEYVQLQLGMTPTEVREIVGSRGKPMDPYWLSLAVGHLERTWRVVCSRVGWARMSFARVDHHWELEWTEARWS